MMMMGLIIITGGGPLAGGAEGPREKREVVVSVDVSDHLRL